VGPGQARLRLMDAFIGLAGVFAQQRPTFLVLDNLHCADPPRWSFWRPWRRNWPAGS
jgi:hypothetical protein